MSDWLDAEGHADRAFEMYERGRWAEAESELRKALSLNPDQAEWHFNLGLTLEAAGRDHDALVSYERAIELMPDQVDPLVAAGIVANRLGRYVDAIRFHDLALRHDPTNEAAYCHKIQSHHQLGDHDEAETTFYLAQHALPEPSAHCLAAIADSLMDRESYARAGWCLREAMRLEPGLPRLRARLGNVYAALGKPQKALQLYLRDLRDDPGNIDTLLDYGELLIEFRRLPEAAEKFRRVLEIEPANVDAHIRLGQIAFECRRLERAQLEFELVLKLDPLYPQVRLSLSEVLLMRGFVDDAQQCLRDEIDALLASRDEDASVTEPAGDHEGEGQTRIGGYDVSGLMRLGSLLLDARMPADASRVLELACALGASATRARRIALWRKLALARFLAGDREGGARISRRVLRYEPDCVASIHNLALAAFEAGRIDVAAGWIQRGLRVDRHDDGLRRLRMRLWVAMAKRAVRRLLLRSA